MLIAFKKKIGSFNDTGVGTSSVMYVYVRYLLQAFRKSIGLTRAGELSQTKQRPQKSTSPDWALRFIKGAIIFPPPCCL